MKDLISIRICVGTYSYIMGGAQLMNLKEEIPEEWRDQVKIDAAVSLPGCDEKTMTPPFVEINGNLMCNTSVEKIVQRLADLIKK